MKRYGFRAFANAWADSEQEAREAVQEALDALNKDPDGPRAFLDDGRAEVIEDDEAST